MGEAPIPKSWYRRRKTGLRSSKTDRTEIKDRKWRGIDRLTRRANKKESALTFVPSEYADSPEVILAVERIADIFRRGQLDLKATLLSVILKLLQQNGLVERIDGRDLASIETRSEVLRTELEWWFDHSKGIYSPCYAPLVDREIPMVGDFLGVVYQSVAKEGVEERRGSSCSTPKRVVDDIVADYVNEKSVVLDPCCGTSQFLLAAAKNITDPSNLWGFDIDEVAVRLARLNVIMRFPDRDFSRTFIARIRFWRFRSMLALMVNWFLVLTLSSPIPRGAFTLLPTTLPSFKYCFRQ